jgi:hypothetical protein
MDALDSQDLDVRIANAHRCIEPAQRGPAGGRGQRRHEADREEGEANAEQLDDQRREQAAGREPEREDRLEPREHAREDGLVRQPGQHREAADVDQRVADADQAEQDYRRCYSSGRSRAAPAYCGAGSRSRTLRRLS